MNKIVLNSSNEFLIKNGQTILNAALQSNFPWPHSCEDGRFNSCKCKVDNGSTFASSTELGPSSEETLNGWILACVRMANTNLNLSIPYINMLSPYDNSIKSRTSMTSRQAKIQKDTHFRIMRILQDNPDLTQRELADLLGMSVGGLNYCLNALIEKGFVKITNFSKSKNKYVYLLTPLRIAEKVALTSRFLKRKMEEYDALKAEIEALRSEADKPDGQLAKKV